MSCLVVVLNCEIYFLVDWETEHKRLAELDVDDFEEFGGEIPLHEDDGPFRSNGQPGLGGRGRELAFPSQRNENFNDLVREASDDFVSLLVLSIEKNIAAVIGILSNFIETDLYNLFIRTPL